MIPSYSAYISRYLLPRKERRQPNPGEQHFVAISLLPRLFALHGIVPDYVNPDGGKAVLGDVVYYRDYAHHFGIEIKIEKLLFTVGEFNNGIVSQNRNRRPDRFLGVHRLGIVLLSWSEFRKLYFKTVRKVCGAKAVKTLTTGIEKDYGPAPSIGSLWTFVPEANRYPAIDPVLRKPCRETERRFIEGLRVATCALEQKVDGARWVAARAALIALQHRNRGCENSTSGICAGF